MTSAESISFLFLFLLLVLPFILVALVGLVNDALHERQRRREREDWLAWNEQIRDGNY